ncbi:hypothetical protein CB0940_03682 [Cercospora beticola]|uniref:Uncharacterized protein n=1 Tax=Cercospora beticola TaxID=122368 RepID=A0A2G5I5G7_CERBT|nr:hypothetical protein CB0940_03682 [Cercospora beticola]PIB00045.1 hypothetical protein CB0940_03682 [Cercospora beticola]
MDGQDASRSCSGELWARMPCGLLAVKVYDLSCMCTMAATFYQGELIGMLAYIDNSQVHKRTARVFQSQVCRVKENASKFDISTGQAKFARHCGVACISCTLFVLARTLKVSE